MILKSKLLDISFISYRTDWKHIKPSLKYMYLLCFILIQNNRCNFCFFFEISFFIVIQFMR